MTKTILPNDDDDIVDDKSGPLTIDDNDDQRNHEEEIGSDIVITRLTAHAHYQTRPPGPVNSSQ